MDNLARQAQTATDERWGGNIHSIRYLVERLTKKGYHPTDYYITMDGEHRLFLAERESPIRASSYDILEQVVDMLPMNIEPGEYCKYTSIVHGEIEVVYVKQNDVPNWPIKTAEVEFSSGRRDSVRMDALTPTGRKRETRPLVLVFGGKGR